MHACVHSYFFEHSRRNLVTVSRERSSNSKLSEMYALSLSWWEEAQKAKVRLSSTVEAEGTVSMHWLEL